MHFSLMQEGPHTKRRRSREEECMNKNFTNPGLVDLGENLLI